MEKRIRVIVYDGTQRNLLGYGWHVDNVTVYAFDMGEYLLSLEDCEENPSEDLIQKAEAQGGKLIQIENNPKIILDSGPTVYGCQVWFGPVDSDGNGHKG